MSKFLKPGKSSWVQSAGMQPHVVSADQYMVDDKGNYLFDPCKLKECHHKCLRDFIQAILAGTPVVVVDNTNSTESVVGTYVAIAQAYGAKVRWVFFGTQISPKVLYERQIHGVPLQKIVQHQENIREMQRQWPPWWGQDWVLVS